MRGMDLAVGLLFLVSGSVAGLGLGGIGDAPTVPESGGPIQGHASLTDASYTGPARIRTTEGVFGIEGALGLEWRVNEAIVTYHTLNRTGGWAGAGYNLSVAVEEKVPPRVERYENASLKISAGTSGRVYLWTNETHGPASLRLFLAPQTDVPLSGSAFGVTVRSEGHEHQYWLPGPILGFGHEGSTYRTTATTAVVFDRFEAEGAINLFVPSGRIEFKSMQGTDTFESGSGRGTVKGVIPAERLSYAFIQIPAADLVIEDFEQKWSTFFTPSAELAFRDNVSFIATDGEIGTDGDRKPLEGDEIRMQGNSTLALGVTGMSDGTEYSNGSWGARPELLPDPGLFATFEGESERMFVNGMPLGQSESAPATTASIHPDDLTFWGQLIGTLLLAWAICWRFVVPMLVVLYNGDPLKNLRRRKILAHLHRVGVAHVRDVHRETGIAVGSVVYHLEVLRRSGHVASARWGNYQAYFVCRPGLAQEDMQRLALLADDTRRRIAQLVVSKGKLTQSELVTALGMTQSAVSRQLCKMTSVGLLRREKDHLYCYAPSDLLKTWFRHTP